MINEKFVVYGLKTKCQADITSGELTLNSVAFIEDTKEIWAQGVFYGGVEALNVINNLTSTSITDALSAAQGKVLNDTKAALTAVLTKTNTTAFVPTTDYHPSTKKYVDDKVAAIPTPDVTAQINVHNTANAAHTDIRTSVNSKVDKITGKDLSTNDYTTTEKTKLASIATGAQVNTVSTVAGRTGAVVLTKTDVGLANVDNTADTTKVVASSAKLTAAKTIALTGAITGSVSTDLSTNPTIVTTLAGFDASKIATGTISIDRLPKSAIERLTIVATDAARFALTIATVQIGDTVKVTATGKMYFVIDDTKLSTEAGYEPYTVGSASSVPWSGITSKPTTVSGYGITDAVLTSDARLTNSRPASDVSAWAKAAIKPAYTAAEVSALAVGATAAAATKLAIPRTINGTIFDGTSNIDVNVLFIDMNEFLLLIDGLEHTITSEQVNNILDASNKHVSQAYSDGMYYPISFESVPGACNMYVSYAIDRSNGIRSTVSYSIHVTIQSRSFIGIMNNINLSINKNNFFYLDGTGKYTDPLLFYKNNSLVGTLSNLPITSRTIIAYTEVATNISLASPLPVGSELLIRCVPAVSFVQPIPNTNTWTSMSGTSITTTANKPFEISIWCYNTTQYSIVVKEQD